MPFIKTTLTDDITGKNADYCFNTDHVVAMQPTRIATVLTFITGQKLIVDVPFEKLVKFVAATKKLD